LNGGHVDSDPMSEPTTFSRPLRLTNAIQPYAWGSRTLLADFLGQPNRDGGPQAELWIGSHPMLPSQVATPGGTAWLDEWIRGAPDAVLGHAVAARFGAELPFLLKVLAVGAPLSIQCHPDRDQARAGFERDERLGLARDAPQRSYRDPNHKPELIVALGRYTALKGFRPAVQIVANLRVLEQPALAPALAPLVQHGDSGLKGFFSNLLSLARDQQARVVSQAARVAAARTTTDPAWEWVARLSESYPEDVSVLSPLYLNLVVLDPGQGLFLPAGELHAYLEGLGLEIMANSDNVLRGGLTAKHVDLPELVALLKFRAEPPRILTPQSQPDGASVYATPVEEFELGLLRLEPAAPRSVGAQHGVEILLALEGQARLTAPDAALELGRGAAVLIPASAGGYGLDGEALLARARVPQP
jgi:mannose-6-phosphate isomerase